MGLLVLILVTWHASLLNTRMNRAAKMSKKWDLDGFGDSDVFRESDTVLLCSWRGDRWRRRVLRGMIENEQVIDRIRPSRFGERRTKSSGTAEQVVHHGQRVHVCQEFSHVFAC